MSSWLRRLSRDRSSKDQSELPMPSRPFSHHVEQSPPQPYKDTQYSSGFNSQDRLQNYRPATSGEGQYNNPQAAARASAGNADGTNRNITTGLEPTPSPLTRAFNDAIRPYQEQIEELRAQLEDTMYRLQTLEDERADMHAWIDKRGLRAGIVSLFVVLVRPLAKESFGI